MRIAHICVTFPPDRDGTGNVCYWNARELARRGYEAHVFTSHVAERLYDELHEGIHIHRLPPLVRYGNAPLLPSLFAQLRTFDLLHLHMPFYGGSEAILLLRQLKALPLVITYHQDVKLQGVPGLISRLHDATIGTSLLQLADRACFTSLDYAHACHYAPLIAEQKIRAAELPNGVNVERFTPGAPARALVERYQLTEKKVVLLVAALDRAHYFKGVPVLLEALATLARSDTACVIVGKGDMLEEYRQKADALGIAHRVHFAGFVPDSELADYYRLADVTVLPSTTMGEAFGLVLIESLACGTPVIASCLPGVRTVVADGQDGLLAAPGDREDLAAKLATMLDLPQERRAAMGLAGRRKVEARYAWHQIGTILETRYSEALMERRRAATSTS